MGPTFRLPLLSLLVLLAISNASATTYYIAANGSDSNNGASKTTPWMHAPGMPSCSGMCASTTPTAGDRFIFRGGDTWHRNNGAASVYMGGTWLIGGTGTQSQPVYYGVDPTWYVGSSWTRPILTGDNPTTTSFITSCPYDMTTTQLAASASGSAWLVVDNFEWAGVCHNGLPGYNQAGTLFIGGSPNATMSNNYFHGWSMSSTVPGTCCNDANMTNGAAYIIGNVWDGSDTYCTGVGACEGWPVYGNAVDVHYNVLRYVSNGFNPASAAKFFYGNLLEYMYGSFDSSAHGGVWELPSVNNSSVYAFNNLVRHTNIGLDYWPEGAGSTFYFFNNVSFDNLNASNLVLIDLGSTGPASSVYFYNNTTIGPGNFPRFYGGHAGQQWKGTGYFSNNHYINYSSPLSNTYTIESGTTTTVTDSGSHIFMPTTTATAQGYTTANNYAPTAPSNSTVGIGNNNTAWCNTMPDAVPQAACKAGAIFVTYDAVNHKAVYPGASTARPASGAWDAGAYQFGSAVTSVAPPTNLSATVQ
jgi:hypothetical protein